MRDRARDHLFELFLVDAEWTGDGCAGLNFDGDDNAVLLERVHDPAESSQEDRRIGRAGVFRAMNGQQHRLQQLRDVLVGPRRGIRPDAGNSLRFCEIGTAKPDVYL